MAKPKTAPIEKKIIEKGYIPAWSLCKIIIDEQTIFKFRIIGVDAEEGSGTTIDEAVSTYLDALPDEKQ